MNILFERLLERCIETYSGKTGRSGMSYILHPLTVMAHVESLPEKIVALGHDYGECRNIEELEQLGIPPFFLDKMRLLAKKNLAPVSEDDAEYRDYIWNLLADPVCRKVKYADLRVNNGFEDSPENGELFTNKQFKRTMAILADAAQGKIYFFSGTFCFNVFSNFYPCELELDGRIWKSAEHFYQAAKFSSALGVQPNAEIYEAICNAETASETKMIAENNLDERECSAWAQSESRYIATARMLNAKYAQGTYPRMLLQKTGNLQLIHESNSDLFWGQKRDGQGQNILGKTLMQMRKSNGDCSVEEMLAK